jgi:hypothetical protein
MEAHAATIEENLMAQYVESGTPINLTSTAVVGATSGTLLGFYVNSTTAGTIVFRVGGASGTVVSGTITPAIGWHRYPMYCPGGAHATIANTLDVTFSFAAG